MVTKNCEKRNIRYVILLNLHRLPIPDREKARIGSDRTAPLQSSSLVGGLYAIDREFFFNIGGLDEKMQPYYGSEDIEITLRIWLCGGLVELLPCSRVGLIDRSQDLHFLPGGIDDARLRNAARITDIWFDEFRKIYYALEPFALSLRTDTTKLSTLKQQLKCKPFAWFLKNIYPESFYNVKYINIGRVSILQRILF